MCTAETRHRVGRGKRDGVPRHRGRKSRGGAREQQAGLPPASMPTAFVRQYAILDSKLQCYRTPLATCLTRGACVKPPLRVRSAAIGTATFSEFLELLDRDGELARVTAQVDPILEISEITDRVCKSPAPH